MTPSPATVLLVDDEPALLGIFARWLQRAGHLVVTAADGESALAIARTTPLDAIVTDVRMPGMDGVELVRRLRASLDRLPPVVAVSGFGHLGERDYLRLGIVASLPKPVERVQLVAAVAQALVDRDEAWRTPPATAPGIRLESRFDSFAAAAASRALALGSGGFAIATRLKPGLDQTVEFHVDFDADAVALEGQGRVRWIDPATGQLGIEIISLEPDAHAWLRGVLDRTAPAAFIP